MLGSKITLLHSSFFPVRSNKWLDRNPKLDFKLLTKPLSAYIAQLNLASLPFRYSQSKVFVPCNCSCRSTLISLKLLNGCVVRNVVRFLVDLFRCAMQSTIGDVDETSRISVTIGISGFLSCNLYFSLQLVDP